MVYITFCGHYLFPTPAVFVRWSELAIATYSHVQQKLTSRQSSRGNPNFSTFGGYVKFQIATP